MRVLIVHPHMAMYGGAETVVVKLATYLTKKGIKNAVLTLSVSEATAKICQEIRFITPARKYIYKIRSTSLLDAMGLINEIIALRKLVRQNLDCFDVINFHNFPSTWSLFPYRKPSVWMCNEPPELWNNPNPSLPLKILRNIGVVSDRMIVAHSVNAICVAHELNAKLIAKRYDREPVIIHYGIDYDFFSSGDRKRAIRTFNLNDSFVVLQVGVIGPQKNQLESVKAIERLKDDISRIKLILAGLGGNPYEKMLKEYISTRNLGKYVTFTGHLSKEIVRNLYQACDVALFPVKSQGGWLAPFEALCASKPIMISPNMTAAHIIEREKIGVVTNDFVNSVRDIYNNPNLYSKISRKGKQWVLENLSWDLFGQKMLALFEKVVQTD